MFSNLINSLVVMTSLATSGSLFVHELSIDKATAAMAPPALSVTSAASKSLSLGGNAHTHTERTSLSQALSDLRAHNPQIQPRNETKKHLMQKRVAKGHHAFDNYNLPIV